MSRPTVSLTGHERTFSENQLIVSKTDTRGIITYANRLFADIADYTLADVLGQPHNMVRNPHMPRCVFKLLWDRINAGKEIFAYVVNCARNGDHYWVFAHVTPSTGENGQVLGYHSNRRVPRRDALRVIEPLYQQLRTKEEESGSAKEGLAAGERMLADLLIQKGAEYDRFVLSL
jgi:PAS domain S-box-containing protein